MTKLQLPDPEAVDQLDGLTGLFTVSIMLSQGLDMVDRAEVQRALVRSTTIMCVALGFTSEQAQNILDNAALRIDYAKKGLPLAETNKIMERREREQGLRDAS